MIPLAMPKCDQNKNQVNIEKIEFKAGACFGTCPIFNMTINADRSVNYHAEMFNKLEGDFTATIDKTSYDSLLTLLIAADLPNAKDRYQVEWTDDQEVILKVTYNGVKPKPLQTMVKEGLKLWKPFTSSSLIYVKTRTGNDQLADAVSGTSEKLIIQLIPYLSLKLPK